MLMIAVWLMLLPVVLFAPGDPEGNGLAWLLGGMLLFGLSLAAFVVFLGAAVINLLFGYGDKEDKN
jgi:hypothetical protein